MESGIALNSTLNTLKSIKNSVTKQTGDTSVHLRLDEALERIGASFEQIERSLALATRGPAPLAEASQHLLMSGGKRVRPTLHLLMTLALESDVQRAIPFAVAAELVHNATLLHDDVIDEGEQRRGKVCTRVVWGNLVSVLSGDWLLTEALRIVDEQGVQGVMSEMLATLRALIEGEVAQLNARNNLQVLEDDYLAIVRGKTASLFRFACVSAVLSAQRVEARSYMPHAAIFGHNVGIAFQVIDDVLDIRGNSEQLGKRAGADLREGKLTLPFIYALKNDPENIKHLLIEARDASDQTAYIDALTRHPAVLDGCAQASAYATALTAEAIVALNALPKSAARDMLQSVVDGMSARTL